MRTPGTSRHAKCLINFRKNNRSYIVSLETSSKGHACASSQESGAVARGFFPAVGHPLKSQDQGSSAITPEAVIGLIFLKII
jgi:hypothetical protein